MKLTLSRETVDGKRFRLFEWEDKRIRVRDDALTCLKIIELFGDEDVTPEFKAKVVMQLVFVDYVAVSSKINDVFGLLKAVLKEICKIDLESSEEPKKVIDWEKDAEYIRTSLWQTYGVSFEELREKVSFIELGEMIGMCPFETPIGQAIYYRTAKAPARTKYNEEEVKRFQERKRFWSLEDQNDNGAALEIFNKIWREVTCQNKAL